MASNGEDITREDVVVIQRASEEQYYKTLSDAANIAITKRNEGKDLVFLGLDEGDKYKVDDGLDLLGLSVNMLSGTPRVATPPVNYDLTYRRDLYASLAMAARMYAVAGEMQEARMFARFAYVVCPDPITYTYTIKLEDYGPPGSPLRRKAETELRETSERSHTRTFVDQYEVIFSGKLALILASSPKSQDVRLGRQIAQRNWILAPREQDPQRVAFPDNNKTDEERLSDRSKRMRESHAVAVGTRIPVRALRERVATKICALH